MRSLISKRTNETTARANKRTMSAGMARAIQGTVGCREGQRDHQSVAINCLARVPFTAFSASPLEWDRGLGMPLITHNYNKRGCNIFSAQNSSPEGSDRPASHCVVVLVTCDPFGGILCRSKSRSRPGAQPGRVAGPHNASG